MNAERPSWRRPLAAAALLRQRLTSVPRKPAPFVVGVNRSGTTLLRLMLDAHPELAIPPETHFIPEMIRRANHESSRRRLVRSITHHPRWGDFGLDEEELRRRIKKLRPLTAAGAIRIFFELYAEQQGKPRWGDKTPRYMRAMPRIQKALPEARFIHLIRDGRDVALSQSERALEDGPLPIAENAERWRRRIIAARELSAEIDGYIEVRYEDLVAEPEATLRRVCEFVELPWEGAMLRYHERAGERLAELDRDLENSDEGPIRSGSERLAGHALTTEPPTTERAGRWRSEMPEAEIAEYERVSGPLLAELGYELSVAPAPAGGRTA